MSKTLKTILIVFISIFILGGICIIGYKLYKSHRDKDKIIDKIDEIDKITKEFESSLSNDLMTIENKYSNDIFQLKDFIENEDFELLIQKLETNKIEIKEQVKIEIDTNTYVKEMPTNIAELQHLVRVLAKMNNEQNRMRMEDQILYKQSISNSIVYVKTIQTNTVTLREEVKTYMKPKMLSYGIGIGFNINSFTKGEVYYDISVHGTMYIFDSVYFGINLGFGYHSLYYPSVGAHLGYKF